MKTRFEDRWTTPAEGLHGAESRMGNRATARVRRGAHQGALQTDTTCAGRVTRARNMVNQSFAPCATSDPCYKFALYQSVTSNYTPDDHKQTPLTPKTTDNYLLQERFPQKARTTADVIRDAIRTSKNFNARQTHQSKSPRRHYTAKSQRVEAASRCAQEQQQVTDTHTPKPCNNLYTQN